MKTIALEGAASALDGQFFKSFPDQEHLKKVLQSYHEEGALAAGAAAVLLDESGATYQGIEDWDLYEQGLVHYCHGSG